MIFSQFSMFYCMQVDSSLLSTRQRSWTVNWMSLPKGSGGPSLIHNTNTTKYTIAGWWCRDSSQQADSVSMSREVLVRWESILYSHKTVDTTSVTSSQCVNVTRFRHFTWLSSVRQSFLFNCITFMSWRPTSGCYISHRHFPFVSSPSCLLSAYEI